MKMKYKEFENYIGCINCGGTEGFNEYIAELALKKKTGENLGKIVIVFGEKGNISRDGEIFFQNKKKEELEVEVKKIYEIIKSEGKELEILK